MNIYIMVDMEEISGIYCSEQVSKDCPTEYAEGRHFLTEDVNACVRACKEAGANKIYVRDCHSHATNFIVADLAEEATGYIMGYTPVRFPFLTAPLIRPFLQSSLTRRSEILHRAAASLIVIISAIKSPPQAIVPIVYPSFRIKSTYYSE